MIVSRTTSEIASEAAGLSPDFIASTGSNPGAYPDGRRGSSRILRTAVSRTTAISAARPAASSRIASVEHVGAILIACNWSSFASRIARSSAVSGGPHSGGRGKVPIRPDEPRRPDQTIDQTPIASAPRHASNAHSRGPNAISAS